MFPDTVDFRNRGARLQQRSGRRLLVRQSQPGYGRREQSGTSARQKYDQLILRFEAMRNLEGSLGGADALRVGIRVAGFDPLDVRPPGELVGHMAVACNDER